MGLQHIQPTKNFDVLNFNEFWSRIYQKMYEILKESGHPLFQFKFDVDVRANGQVEMSDQAVSTEKALMRLNLVGLWRQAGVATVEDHYNAAIDYLEKDGVKDPEMFTTSPKKVMEGQIAALEQKKNMLINNVQAIQNQLDRDQKAVIRTRERYKKEINKGEAELDVQEEGE